MKKKYLKVPGGGESFDGIPGEERKKAMENSRGVVKVLMEGVQFLKIEIINRRGRMDYIWKSPLPYNGWLQLYI